MDRNLPFPYPYGSDLHWLWGWGHRIDLMLCEEGYVPSSHDWMTFRPCEPADDAMMRYSIDYPTVIADVKEKLAAAEAAFEKLTVTPTEQTEFIFADRVEILEARIKKACELIAQREGIVANPKSSPESNIRTRARDPFVDVGRESDSSVAGQSGEAKRPQASEPKLFPNGPPEDESSEKAILFLVSRRDGKTADFDLLVEFFGGDGSLAGAMQAEIRRLRSDGVTTLPANRRRSKKS